MKVEYFYYFEFENDFLLLTDKHIFLIFTYFPQKMKTIICLENRK